MAEEGSQQGIRCAMATVVAVTGSSYRRPGARLLTREDGAVVGCISGGCLERDVIQKSRLAIVEGHSRLMRYDTAEDAEGGFGLGCGGEIVILLEPLAGDSLHLRYLKQIHSRQRPAVLVTGFGGNNTGALALLQSGQFANRAGISPDVMNSISRMAERCLVDAQTRTQIFEQANHRLQLLFEYVTPARNLVLFGAGPEAVPLANCAHALGYRVTLVDERPGTIARIRKLLPGAIYCCCEAPGSALERIGSAGTACVIATHNVAYDLRAVNAAITYGVSYIGLLGPKQRARQLIEVLLSEGCATGVVEAIHAPVGLDIGGDTPEQIALSILAEIQATAAGRGGGFLRNRNAPIHDPAAPQKEHATA
jgi:xanthine/CO dehydrogenase XdhC/CoxF family maturation factor